MADVETFDVDLDVVRLYMPGLPTTLTSATYPTSTQLTAIIKLVAGKWCARARQVGLKFQEAAALPDSQGYQIMQDCIARGVAIRLMIARDRVSSDLVDRYTAESEADFALLVEQPGAAGDMQDTSATAPGILNTHVTDQATALRVQSQQSLAVRLAAQGRL
jgi:hypothetical protein